MSAPRGQRIPFVLLLLMLIGIEAACVGARPTEAKAAEDKAAENNKPAQPGLFTVSQEQLAHLRVVPVTHAT